MKLFVFLSAALTLWSGASNGASTESLQQATQKKALKAQIIRSMEESIAWMSRKDVSLAQIQNGFAKKSEALIEQLEAWNQENPDRTVDVAVYQQTFNESCNHMADYQSKTLLILKTKQELEKTKSLENYLFGVTKSLNREEKYSNVGILIFVVPQTLTYDLILFFPALIASFITGF